MKKYLILFLLFSNLGYSLNIVTLEKDNKNNKLQLNLSGFGNITVGYFKENILPKFISNKNPTNFIAMVNGKKVSDYDLLNSSMEVVEQVKVPKIDDYIKLLAELIDDKTTALERKIVEKIYQIKNIKDEKIKLIETIMEQSKDFKNILSDLLGKLIKDPNTISQWSIYKNLSSGVQKDIFEQIIKIVMN